VNKLKQIQNSGIGEAKPLRFFQNRSGLASLGVVFFCLMGVLFGVLSHASATTEFVSVIDTGGNFDAVG